MKTRFWTLLKSVATFDTPTGTSTSTHGHRHVNARACMRRRIAVIRTSYQDTTNKIQIAPLSMPLLASLLITAVWYVAR